MSGNRLDTFKRFEQPALRALPRHPYQYVEIKRIKVNIDVHYERRFYSVPHQCVGLSLEVHAGENLMRMQYQGNEIATQRRMNRYGFSTEPSHMLLSVLYAS